MSKTTILAKVDTDAYNEAETLFHRLGLDMDTAINLFLYQAILQQGLPFSIKLSQEAPKEASQEDDFEDFQALYDALWQK